MVLFLHVTSHVESDPHQDLLREKGGNGFPYLAWMDADGDVLAQQGDRTVEGFQKTYDALQSYLKAKATVEGGDAKAKADLFLASLELGKLSADEARKQMADLSLSKEQKTKAEQSISDLEVMEAARSMRSPDQQAEAGKKFAAMLKQGYQPGSKNVAGTFWSAIMTYAEQENDAKLFAKALAVLQKEFGDQPSAKRFLDAAKERLEKLKKAGK